MHDVARRAGVSQTTVSFVINGRRDISISDETRERVQEAVRELNYRPNAMARSLRSNKSHFIGLISDEIATTPHAGQIIKGAQDAAWAQGKLLLLINTGGDESLKNAAANALLERQVESVIYATMYHRPVNPPAILRQVPTVLLDCFVPDRSLPSVAPDEVQGGRTATEHLLSLGHRRVGFVNTVDAIPAAVGRLKGYRQALAAYDVGFDEILVSAEVSEASGGYRGVMDLMSRDQPPTAIFMFNDRMAMGAYDALRNLGISISKDVAIVGFDNEEIIAAHLYPPLTTVQLPHYEMGQWAVVYQLTHSADSPVGLPIQHKIACPLVKRT
jgi:LacI family transcriptional regulator